MTWATRITILRLVLVPVFVTLIITYDESDPREEVWRYAAIAVFLIASLSDALDGYLARHCNQRSALGALLDPIADKLLLLASLVTLGLIPLDHLRPAAFSCADGYQAPLDGQAEHVFYPAGHWSGAFQAGGPCNLESLRAGGGPGPGLHGDLCAARA
jgi:hypothetical protein